MAARTLQFQLNQRTGVPVYRQLMDQVLVAKASGALQPGDQLPTVRQLAVDLSINPNTVVRAYKELEIRGFLATQQGSGTFITDQAVEADEVKRQERLTLLAGEFVARAAAEGYTLNQIIARLQEMSPEASSNSARS